MMVVKYKIGDHVIITDPKLTDVNHENLLGEKGIVAKYYGGYICMVHLKDDRFPKPSYFRINEIEIDHQYYREERLNKLLGDEV